MNKEHIMKTANNLMDLLSECSDGDFVDEVCARVSSNDPFDLEEEDE